MRAAVAGATGVKQLSAEAFYGLDRVARQRQRRRPTANYARPTPAARAFCGPVIFANRRNAGGPVWPPTGTATAWIDIDRDAGTVVYCDGTSLNDWDIDPSGHAHEIYALADLPAGALIIR